MTVPFASKGEDRIGSSFDPPFRHAGEVNSQERKRWIWHRINQIPHQKLSFGGDLIILAAKRNDSMLLAVCSGIKSFHHLGNDVRVEAATIDQVVRPIVASRALQNDFLTALENPENLFHQANITAARSYPGGVSLGNFLIIDNAGFRDTESLDSNGMRLELFEPLGSDYFQALEPVGDASTMQLIEPRQLFLARCYHHFSAQFIGHRIFVAEFDQRFSPGNTAPSLQRPRAIVQPGMNDTAVVAGLVLGQLGFLFEDQKLRARICLEDF